MHQPPYLIIPSDLERLEDVQSYSEKIKQWANLKEEKAASVSLALSEAVTNAILHGNKEDAEKKVKIRASLQGNELQITVEDEGEGFVPAEVPNPTAEENLLNTSGRGVFLMNQICDDVKYSEKGNQVTLLFKL